MFGSRITIHFDYFPFCQGMAQMVVQNLLAMAQIEYSFKWAVTMERVGFTLIDNKSASGTSGSKCCSPNYHCTETPWHLQTVLFMGQEPAQQVTQQHTGQFCLFRASGSLVFILTLAYYLCRVSHFLLVACGPVHIWY